MISDTPGAWAASRAPSVYEPAGTTASSNAPSGPDTTLSRSCANVAPASRIVTIASGTPAPASSTTRPDTAAPLRSATAISWVEPATPIVVNVDAGANPVARTVTADQPGDRPRNDAAPSPSVVRLRSPASCSATVAPATGLPVASSDTLTVRRAPSRSRITTGSALPVSWYDTGPPTRSSARAVSA